MKKKDIIQSFVHVQRLRVGGEPDPAWVSATRTRLLARARVDQERTALAPARKVSAFVSLFAPTQSLAYQPVLAVIVAIAVVFGGSVGAVSAAMDSLPGDPLYRLKLAAERTQVAVAQSDTTKAELTVAFIGRRVDEVDKLVHKPAANTSDRVDVAVRQIKEDLTTVKDTLTDLQTRNASPEAVKIAQLIDEKSEGYSDTLKKSVAELPEQDQANVKEARALVADLSVRAVAVLVEAHANGGTALTDEELTKKVANKIQSATNEAASVATNDPLFQAASSGETASQALSALDTAKKLLDDNQFGPALSKYIEGNELVLAAQQIVDATNGTTARATMSTSTSSGATFGSASTTIGIPALPESTVPAPSAPSSTSEPVTGMTTGTTQSSGG